MIFLSFVNEYSVYSLQACSQQASAELVEMFEGPVFWVEKQVLLSLELSVYFISSRVLSLPTITNFIICLFVYADYN